MKPISFRSFDLQSGPYRIKDVGELFSSPQKDIIYQELARADNAVAVFDRYSSRKFTLSGTIRDVSSDALESAIDALKLNLLNQSGDLAAGWAGGTRYWDAECQNVNISRGTTDITRAGYSAQFFMEVAFPTSGIIATLATATATTLASQQLAVSNVGTALAIPYITLTLTNIDPNNADVSIFIGNPASNEYLQITDTFADGDVLLIDCLKKQTFRGAELLNPIGHYPRWAPGNGIMDYSDTGSGRTMSLLATYPPRYF